MLNSSQLHLNALNQPEEIDAGTRKGYIKAVALLQETPYLPCKTVEETFHVIAMVNEALQLADAKYLMKAAKNFVHWRT